MREVSNVFGYPAINSELLKEFKDYEVVVGVDPFLRRAGRSKKPVLIIDSFAVLESCGVPVLGYDFNETLGIYLKTGIKHSFKNKIRLHSPALNNAESRLYPELDVLVEVMDAHIAGQYEKVFPKYKEQIQKPKTDTDKWLRATYMEYRNAKKTAKEKEV